MNIRYKIGNAWIEVEADTIQEIFRKLTAAREVFSIARCGLCGSEEVYPRYRKSSGYDFYEIECQCKAVFSFGETRGDHVMFPKRKDKNGEWIPNGGWTKYERPAEQEQGF